MANQIKKMPTPLGIGAGQTATCDLPTGLTYNRLMIEMNVNDGSNDVDVPIADWGDYLDELRLLVDGDAKIRVDASDLVAINKFRGQSMVAGVLPLFLAQPYFALPESEFSTGYDTGGPDGRPSVSSFSLEMDQKAGITVNSLNVYAKRESTGRAFFDTVHYRIQKYTHNQGVVGQAEISDIRKNAYSMLGYHITTDDIGDVEIEHANREVLQMSKLVRDADADVRKRVPQTGYTHIDFVSDDVIIGALPMQVQDHRIIADFTATGNFNIYAESINGAAG